MIASTVRVLRASRKTVMRRRTILYVLGAAVAVMLTGLAAVSPAGPASAQDGTQPLAAQPPGNAPPAQPTTDPITNEQIELLKESGLIDKQSRLSEGLLLMDRQLRQAEHKLLSMRADKAHQCGVVSCRAMRQP